MNTIIVFVYLGLQVKWNLFSSNNSHHTNCIHKGLHAGKWPDLMTYKPDSVSTLRYHWTDYTRRPLEPQVHWDATGTTLADASRSQWRSSGNLHNWNTLEHHCKVTGTPLEAHWKRTGYQQFFFQSYSSEHWGLSSTLTLRQCTLAGPVYSGMLLGCHWLSQCTLGYHWATQRILQGTLKHHWKNLVESAPHWNATG